MPNSEQTLRTALRDSAHSEREPTTQEPFDPLVTVHRRIDQLVSEFGTLSSDLLRNTHATQANAEAAQANAESIARVEGAVGEVRKDTSAIVEFFQAAKGAFKVLGWLGIIFKWVAGIGAAAGAAWAAWYHLPK